MRDRSPERAEAGARAPASVADEELRWFFSIREGTLASPFFDELSAQRHPAEPEAGDEETRAYWQIRRWLLGMSDHDAGVLKAAYRPGPWPPTLREELGRLTGVVVRLASADARSPDRPCEQDALEARVALHLEAMRANGRHKLLAPYLGQALELFRTARRSYLRQRGHVPCATRGLS